MVDAPDNEGGEASAERICWQCGETFSADLEYCPDDGNQLVELDPSDTKDILVGRVFDYRFRIVRKLGEGGMSRVYSARRLDEEGEVALKVLKADFLRNPEVRKRFMYEARVISNLEHDNAVDLFDFGQAPDGSFYMVMELLEGQSLAERLDGGALSYREIFAIVPPVCEVLAEAHEQDVIHRDLKPENIFLSATDERTPNPKLLDFGIAKHLRSRTMTKNDQLWGTPAYMSPEQASGDPVAGTADIYATGVMLYELVSGILPFRASTAMGFAVKHMHREASPMSSVPGLRDVPARLDDFVLEMLAKTPSDRPDSMQVVADELRAIEHTLFDEQLLETVPSLQTNYDEVGAPTDDDIAPEEVPPETAEELATVAGDESTDVLSRADIEAGMGEMPDTPVRGSAASTSDFETPILEWQNRGGEFVSWLQRTGGMVTVGVVAVGVVVAIWAVGFGGSSAPAESENETMAAKRDDAGASTSASPQVAATAAGVATGVADRARDVALKIGTETLHVSPNEKGAGESTPEPSSAGGHRPSTATPAATRAAPDDPESAEQKREAAPAPPASSDGKRDEEKGLSDENVNEAVESTF